MKISETIKSADWKTEKHVPAICAPEKVKAGEKFEARVCVGKEIAHPNTSEHHISWIGLYFKAEDAAVCEIGKVAFSARGESAKGAGQGPAYAEPFAAFTLKLAESGELIAVSYCNLHGLWESSVAVTVA
jgi:superoxide reductase